jgi:hypothetical protein
MPSECIIKYLQAMEDPFTTTAGACVPYFAGGPSGRYSTNLRGTFLTSSTSSIGTVSVNPWMMCYSGGLTNTAGTYTADGIVATTSAYTGNTFPDTPIPLPVGVGAAGTNSPFIPTYDQQDLQVRVVGAGLRVRNTTPLMQRGGTLIGIEEPNHSTITGYTTTQVLTFDQASFCDSVSTGWCSVVWHPVVPEEYEFHTSAEFLPFLTPPNTGAALQRGPDLLYNQVLGFIASAPPSTPQTYEYEAVVIFEAKGFRAHGQLPSDSDPAGMGWVQNLVRDTGARKPKKDRSRWVQTLLRAGINAGNALMTGGPVAAVVSAGNSAIGALFSE